SPMLEAVRESYRSGRPLEWIRVHDLPDFVYFDHSIHVAKGVGCASCHGRVDDMPLTWRVATLQMDWCLDCHRHPERYVRPLRRREFLKLMAASLALGGLTACTSQPPEKIVPYVKAPEDVVPGKPLFFATAVAHPGGIGTGVLVESHMGRPTKVEGNPEHPASLGATDAAAQASVLTLYDPDRSQTLTYLVDIRPWSDFLTVLRS